MRNNVLVAVKQKDWKYLLGVFLVGMSVAVAFGILAISGVSAATPDGKDASPTKIYIPMVAHNYPLPPSIFGVEILDGKVSPVIEHAASLAPSWARIGGMSWARIESTRGVYDWSRVAGLEHEIQLLSQRGLVPIVTIQGTPSWAQAVPGYTCGPMTDEASDDFAAFVAAVVRRYSAPPYNVHYWEIWNEEDVAYQLVKPTSEYGCLGDINDPYYGGGTYAKILQAAYPAIKAADPFAQVVFGGLLLDCDPGHPPQGKDCSPGRFLEGALRAGAGNFFDILSYHAYPHWSRFAVPMDWDLEHFAWKHRGGILLGKLEFLREVMSRYGVDKPVMMNEGGLLCHPTNPDCNNGGAFKAQFHDDQANYVVRLYVRGWANGLKGITWYTLNGPGWRQGGLLDGNQQPRPAYHAYRFLHTRLLGAKYEGEISTGGVEGYAFRRGATRVEIYWRNDGTVTPLSVPAGTTGIFNYLGNPLTPQSGNQILVGFTPVIVERN